MDETRKYTGKEGAADSASEVVWIFFTPREAIEAIRHDLAHYPPQRLMLRQLCLLTVGEAGVFYEQRSRADGLWLSIPKTAKRRFVSYEEIPALICDYLETANLPPNKLAKICGCVFQESARAGPGPEDMAGIWINTGMAAYRCRRCGRCCTVLDYRGELTLDDYTFWQKSGRNDILDYVRVFRRDGEIVGFRIWVDPETGDPLDHCPWLKHDSPNNRYTCLIHTVRPKICRQYPGTRKHAAMTGCPAFA